MDYMENRGKMLAHWLHVGHMFVLYLRYCIIFNLLYYMLGIVLYLYDSIVPILFYYTCIIVLYLIIVLYFLRVLSSHEALVIP